jgi:hypothetical protein
LEEGQHIKDDEAENAREILKDLKLPILGINLRENKDENEE